MNNIILVFIFILLHQSAALNAQNINADTVDVIQILSLPAIKEDYRIFNTVILNESAFHALFKKEDLKNLSVVDFSKHKIIGSMVCSECLSECNDTNNLKLIRNYVWDYSKYHLLHSLCHSGDCNYSQHWFLVARSEYPEVEFTLHPVDPETHCWFNDIIIGSDSIYKRIFKKIPDNSLYDINFNKNVIMREQLWGIAMQDLSMRLLSILFLKLYRGKYTTFTAVAVQDIPGNTGFKFQDHPKDTNIFLKRN